MRAERKHTACTNKTFNKVILCTGTVRIPSMQANFRAESSTDAASVDEILARVGILSEQIAVPGHSVVRTREQEHSQAAYLEELRKAGLVAELKTRRIYGLEGGHVLDTEPAPGTMLRPGDTVTVTVSAAPRGPADEISVGMNSSAPDGEYGQSLDDEEIRSGKATIRLRVGSRLWAYFKQVQDLKLIGETDGDALTPSTWAKDPNKGRSWEAARAGTSTVTLVLIDGDDRIDLGTVTVEVYR